MRSLITCPLCPMENRFEVNSTVYVYIYHVYFIKINLITQRLTVKRENTEKGKEIKGEKRKE